MTTFLVRALSLGVLASSALVGVATAGTLAPDLANLSANKSVEVIVNFTGSERPNLAGLKLHESEGHDWAVYRMTVGQARTNAGLAGVNHITPNRPVYGVAINPVYDYAPQTMQPNAFTSAGVRLASYANQGGSPTVGVVLIDSGVDSTHPSLMRGGKSVVVLSQDFTSENNNKDGYGHGTHVAGIIASQQQGGSTPTIYGIAPGVQIISYKVLNKNGVSSDAMVKKAIDAAVALKKSRPDLNIKVINLSLGRPVFEPSRFDPLCLSVEKAWQNGITVVVAAGNWGRTNYGGTHGYGTITSPANDPLVMTVGAINTESSANRADDRMTTYSSKGPTLFEHVVKPDLVTPGNKIFSLVARGNPTLQGTAVVVPATGTPQYMLLSGTSMAAGEASGAVAALLSSQPSLDPDQVKARLMKTAAKLPRMAYNITVTDSTGTHKYTIQNDIFTVGAGSLDLSAALSKKIGDEAFTIEHDKNAASPVAVPYKLANGHIGVKLRN